jgi:hypothetical protein
MNTNRIIKIQVWFSLIGASGLFIWWFSMPVFLPVADAANNFQEMILDNDWIFVNLIGLVAALLILLGFPGFYFSRQEKFSIPGFTGLLLATTGLVLFTCIQYYETIIWPAAAGVNPELVRTSGELVSGNSGVVAGLLVSGILLGAGYILFGISALRTGAFSKVPVWLLMIGAPVFGNAIIFPLRTAGLLMFVAGTIWLSLHTRKMLQANDSY